MKAIEVKGVYKQLGKFQLRDVSFTVEQGTVMGLIGQNGAGKSTTIRCLLRLLKTTTGSISIFEQDLTMHELDIKQQIGVVFDDLHVPDHLTPQDLQQLYQDTYTEWDCDLFSQFLDRFDLSLYDKVKTLSRGMRMRLSLALALSHRPKLLLLDEPTSGLDPIMRDEVLDILLEYMENGTNSILFSSHITSDLEKIADYFTFMEKGEIIFCESKDALFYDYGIWSGTKEQAANIPAHAIIGRRRAAFGVELLVKKVAVPNLQNLTQPTIEDIMVFYVKGRS